MKSDMLEGGHSCLRTPAGSELIPTTIAEALDDGLRHKHGSTDRLILDLAAWERVLQRLEHRDRRIAFQLGRMGSGVGHE